VKILEDAHFDKPLRIFFADEMRFGLMTNEKRSWNLKGKRTSLLTQMNYANRYLFSALSVLDGESFHLIGFRKVSGEITDLFLDALQEHFPDTHNVIIWDNAPFHKPGYLSQKEHMTLIHLPPYGQELNPAERFFGEMRKATANQIFDDIAQIEKLPDEEVSIWMSKPDKVKQLCRWDYIVEQLEEWGDRKVEIVGL